MKKRFLTLLLSATMLFSIVGFTACTNGELEAKIAELQAQIAIQQTQILTQQEQIADLQEQLELREETIKNYAKGDKVSLETAYKLGLLTWDDLLSIAYHHNKGRKYNEDLMSEDFVPQPKTPEALSEELELEIRKACLHSGEIIDKYHIGGYYGIYNNCVAIIIAVKLEGSDYILRGKAENICGVTFEYTPYWLGVYCMKDV